MEIFIGITCGHQWKSPERYYVNSAYIEAVLTAGGTPILIPAMDAGRLEAIMDSLSGLLIPGGIDIDAALFHEEPHPGCGEVDPVWDQLEVTVIRQALARQMPLLAICRGIQILNVAAGGSLIQDIPAQVPEHIKHAQDAPRYHGSHRIKVEAGSRLSVLLGSETIFVNSFHHQAVKEPAPGFRVTARSSDGVVEAIEHETLPYVLGVQWHPEHMVKQYPVFARLFERLVKEAEQYQTKV